MSSNKVRRALISGAGIAGLTAAYWLTRQNWEVVLLEQASALRKGEFIIDFAGTGWDVAVKMGIDSAITERRTPIKALCFQDDQGRDKARIEMQDFVDSMGVAGKHASINRRHLQELLYEHVESRAEFRYSSSIQSITESDEGVDIVLQDGTQERYDLVIGADGLHSNVRKLVYGEEEQFARYLGYHVSAFRVSNIASKASGVMGLMRQPNKQAGILDTGDGDALALFVYAQEHDHYVPRSQRKQVLIDTFGGMGGMIPTVLNEINDDTALYMDTVTQIQMPSWHTRRVVLLGDAAYCLTLVSGQGASMAMGGAYALAMALKSTDTIEDALKQYEARTRPFVEELQAKTRRLAGNFVPSTRLGLWATERAVSWMRFGWVRNFAAKQFSIQSLFEREALTSHTGNNSF